MIALVDCNSFFCSVEKVFHPGLNGKPVCVLSNNDGCIVALTPEAKAVGLHRGDPLFKVQDIVTRNNVTIFSTNMYLYAAMSKRITSIMRKTVQHVENYSIDESFCYLESPLLVPPRGKNTDDDPFGYVAEMRELAERIRLWTDIPVSVGIAPSKTLAKMGSKFAKKYRGYRGVCMIDTDEKRRKALQLFDLSDVWGIGRHTLEKLNYYGVTTPLEFADKSESWVKTHLYKPGIQTWMELNGIPCIDTTEIRKRQNICTSRSFGDMIEDFDSLKASIVQFASSCANKLRGQGSVCKTITVFIASNRFREDLPQYSNAYTHTLSIPTSDTLEICHAAIEALRKIFYPGISYKRSGVIVGDITDACPQQLDMFDTIRNRPQRQNLMKAIDNLNHQYGLHTVQVATLNTQHSARLCRLPQARTLNITHCAYAPKCDHRSHNYLTDINDILTIKI